MSTPDKPTYILYGVVYIALGVWALSSFLKIFGSSKNFLKQIQKKEKIVLAIIEPIEKKLMRKIYLTLIVLSSFF